MTLPPEQKHLPNIVRRLLKDDMFLGKGVSRKDISALTVVGFSIQTETERDVGTYVYLMDKAKALKLAKKLGIAQ